MSQRESGRKKELFILPSQLDTSVWAEFTRQAHLIYIAGSLPGHRNKASITAKRVVIL